jgi:glutamine amidotransferase
MPRVAVLDFGMGNLRSVAKAVERVGGDAVVTADPGEAHLADGLVVPGQGHFGACVRNLAASGLDRAFLDFARAGRPVLGVCLGMQVLFPRSEEAEDGGFALLRGAVHRLPATVKVPHMGWNEVAWVRDHPVVEGIPSGTRFYFVHSYACLPDDPGDLVGETDYGVPFAAAVAAGSVFATQFHPEKSGEQGLVIYRNFVKGLS